LLEIKVIIDSVPYTIYTTVYSQHDMISNNTNIIFSNFIMSMSLTELYLIKISIQ